MSLHQSFGAKQQQIRLTALTQMPTQADIQYALSEAQKNPKTLIELPFRGATDLVLLQVLLLSKDAAPRWIMHSGPTADTTVLWTMDSHDVVFITTLVDQSQSSGAQQSSPAQIPDELRPQAPRSAQQPSPMHLEAIPPSAFDTASGAQPVAAPPPMPVQKQSLGPVPLDMPAVQSALQSLPTRARDSSPMAHFSFS